MNWSSRNWRKNIRVCVVVMSRMCGGDGKHKGYLLKIYIPLFYTSITTIQNTYMLNSMLFEANNFIAPSLHLREVYQNFVSKLHNKSSFILNFTTIHVEYVRNYINTVALKHGSACFVNKFNECKNMELENTCIAVIVDWLSVWHTSKY